VLLSTPSLLVLAYCLQGVLPYIHGVARLPPSDSKLGRRLSSPVEGVDR
jgi:hypothetical protein